MSGNRPDLHTPQHDQWDQGGYCNNLVIDDDGCGTVCGYRAPRDYTPTDGEVLTAVVLYRAIASVDAPPPTIETIATPEETARYLGEYQRWLAEHDAALIEGLADEYADSDREQTHGVTSVLSFLYMKARQRREEQDHG